MQQHNEEIHSLRYVILFVCQQPMQCTDTEMYSLSNLSSHSTACLVIVCDLNTSCTVTSLQFNPAVLFPLST